MLAGVLFLRLYFHRVRYPAGCIRYQRIFCSENGHARLPSRRRSADRTRSPAAISQKREFFKCPPETFGYFAPEVAKFGVRRPFTKSQKPTIGRHFCHCRGWNL